MTAGGWAVTGLAFAAGICGQVLVQGPTGRDKDLPWIEGWMQEDLPSWGRGPLGHANQVRASRRLHAAPSSMAFRLSAGGVKEAAADALWLTVLPRLGRSWVEPERKGAWIEAVTTAMTDANPRALTPVIYAAYFLEGIERRHPAIERVLERAMEAREKAPFEEPRRANAASWQLPEVLGMNLYMFGTPEEKKRAVLWLREAAAMPTCPDLVIDFIAAFRAREGSPLEGWELWIHRAFQAENPEFRRAYLEEADRARLAALRRWASAAEARRTPPAWPSTVDEVLAEAPEPERLTWDSLPRRRAAVAEGVLLHPDTRDIEIPSLTARLEKEGLEDLRLLLRHFELTNGRKAASLADLDSFSHRPVAPPPRHGTRRGLNPATGEPEVVPDLADPRSRR